MTIAKKVGIEEYFALELYAAAAQYLVLFGVTQHSPHGTPLDDDSPKPEHRRREEAAEGLGLYLGYVMYDMVEAGCHDPEQLRRTICDHFALVVRAAHEQLLPNLSTHPQLINA